MNEAVKSPHPIRNALLTSVVALALPSIVAESLHAFIEAAFGYYELYTYTFWRGIPFHFIHRFEFGDQYRYLSAAYLGDALFWAGLILALRYWLRVRRFQPSFATPQ